MTLYLVSFIKNTHVMKYTFKNVASLLSIAALLMVIGAFHSKSANSNETGITPTELGTATQEIWLESLLTDTPQEGRELAITLARKSIGAIQTDPEVRKQLRGDYARDTEQLILSAQVIAIEFQTIAAANNYWRDK